MLKTLSHIERHKLADRIEIYDRSARLLYRNELKADRWTSNPRALEVMEAERSRKPANLEMEQFQKDWSRINELMEKRQASLEEFEQARKVYEKYKWELG